MHTRVLVVALALVVCGVGISSAEPDVFPKADGYRGIWYFNQETKDEYVYKYSGGLGTYCMKHIPMAVYAPEAEKTFFVYGGTTPGNTTLLEMISYYDHKTGSFPRPTILMDKKTTDAHDNPVISIDPDGHIWVFLSAHGRSRPAYILRSSKPYDIDRFENVQEFNFSYPQPWYIKGKGFLFLHTYYDGIGKGRSMYWMTSKDGREWSERKPLSHIGQGHYQVSWPCGGKVGTAFDYHPAKGGLNFRTNLYYIETADMGETWKTVQGDAVATPLEEIANPALVHDYESEGKLVYVKDVNYDAQGNPAILYVTSKGWKPGPENGPHEWMVAHWTGSEWTFSTVTASDHNYDSGSIYIESDGVWKVIGPTEPGPQAYGTGGEIAIWSSKDDGKAWTKERQLTSGSPFNHGHVRRPLNAAAEFYGFWADGDARKMSESRLYFCDKTGERVVQLPYNMDTESK